MSSQRRGLSAIPSRVALQGDVYIYLHKKLDENFEVIAGLERRVEELESENEGLRESAKKQLSEVSQSADYRISLLEREKAQLRQVLGVWLV